MTLDQVSLPPFLEDTESNLRMRANVVYEICRADTHLARMLTSLEAAGKLENTLVVVTSDNGTAIVLAVASLVESPPCGRFFAPQRVSRISDLCRQNSIRTPKSRGQFGSCKYRYAKLHRRRPPHVPSLCRCAQ